MTQSTELAAAADSPAQVAAPNETGTAVGAAPVFDTKLVVVLREDLPAWQKLNATIFLVSGIAATDPTTVGPPYEDADGARYLPMFRQPGFVYAASAPDLRRAYGRAMSRGVDLAIFTDELFTTTHDAANRAAVAAISGADLALVGIAFRAERKTADKIVKGLSFHP